MINYSAVIPSIGYNENLQWLLESLTNQSFPLKEAIIMLSDNVPIWDSYYPVRFIYTCRGMIIQRTQRNKSCK